MIVFFWFAFSLVVAVGANTRGRHGGGWFLLSLVISPLIAGLLLLALPRGSKSKAPGDGIYFSELGPNGAARREARKAREQLQQDQRAGVFRPDGMLGQTPFRTLPNGEVEAMLQGGPVRFRTIAEFRLTDPTAEIVSTASPAPAPAAKPMGSLLDDVSTDSIVRWVIAIVVLTLLVALVASSMP